MSEVNTKPRYALRLLGRVAFYDIDDTQMFWDFPKDKIVIDPKQIAMLEARGAGKFERINIIH